MSKVMKDINFTKDDVARLEFYRLINEGYNDILAGREISADDLEASLANHLNELEQSSIY